MKKLVALAFVLLSFFNGLANEWNNREIYCNFKKVVCPVGEYEDPEPPANGRRTPSVPVMCLISERDGVTFLSSAPTRIIYYEILDEEGMVMTFPNDTSFVHALFSLSGEYELRFTTDEYLYIGYVEL